MVSPINLPGLSRSDPDLFSGIPSRRGGNEGTGPGVASDHKVGSNESAKIRSADDAMNVLKARLSQRLEQQLGKGIANGAERFSPAVFEAPSAELVAQRVLGFVQQRLQAEARAGAETERLAGLLTDARAGIAQGFAEAREQIETMGLMDDRLGRAIEDSFSRITSGLDGLQDRFVERPSGTLAAGQEMQAGYRVERASESLFAFQVTTAEGDRVTVRMAEQRYSGAYAETVVENRGGGNSQDLQFGAVSGFSGRYSFNVEGDLNGQEQRALAGLFERVEKVSDRFFDGDIQGAFRKAGDLNLDGQALASFSLSLTATRIVSASAYESVARQPSDNAQLRPLGGLARDLQSVARSASEGGVSAPAFKGLMNSLLQDIRQWQSERNDSLLPASESLMNEFIDGVTDSLKRPSVPSG